MCGPPPTPTLLDGEETLGGLRLADMGGVGLCLVRHAHTGTWTGTGRNLPVVPEPRPSRVPLVSSKHVVPYALNGRPIPPSAPVHWLVQRGLSGTQRPVRRVEPTQVSELTQTAASQADLFRVHCDHPNFLRCLGSAVTVHGHPSVAFELPYGW